MIKKFSHNVKILSERSIHFVYSFFRRLKDTSGATSIEYSLMIALVALTAITAITLLGESVQDTYEKTNNALAQLESPNSGDSGGDSGGGSGGDSGGDSGPAGLGPPRRPEPSAL